MKEIDMVTDDSRRWTAGIYGLPLRSGKLKDISSFDASFFGVHAKQVQVMDPQLRIMLEITYEAIVDAGINPSTIKGSRTGVFIGVSTSEADEFWTKDVDTINGSYLYTVTYKKKKKEKPPYHFASRDARDTGID